MTPRTRVGTCGFAESHAKTFRDFDLVEVQQSFYPPPRPSTAQRWRMEAPDGFVFTLQAWRLITHASTSPTYRRLRAPLSARQRARGGGFQWNPVTRMAWRRILTTRIRSVRPVRPRASSWPRISRV